MSLYITEKNGRRRKAEKRICEYCGEEYLARVSLKTKYCSRKCSQKSRLNRVLKKCAFCGNTFEKRVGSLKDSKSGLYFCTRDCKDNAQKIECSILKISHYGSTKTDYRSVAFRNNPIECVDCKEKQKFLLVVHHIDGDRKNNKKENLEILCHNCHAKKHIKKVNGDYVLDSKWLTDKSILKELGA